MNKKPNDPARSVFDLVEKIREEQVLGSKGVAEKKARKRKQLLVAETYRYTAACAAVLVTAFFSWFVWVTIGIYAIKKVVDFVLWDIRTEKPVDTTSVEYWQNKGLLTTSKMIQVPITSALLWSIFTVFMLPKQVIIPLALLIAFGIIGTIWLAITQSNKEG